MKIFKLMVLQLLFYITRTGAQSFSCDASLSTSLCPGTIALCTCYATGTSAQTRWVFTTLNLQCPGGSNFIALAQCAASSGTCGPYLSAANNIGGSCPPSSSTLNITANQSLSGLMVECRDTSSGPPGGTLVGTKNISVVAPPGPPNVMAQTIGPDMVQVVVSHSPNGGLPTSYNVTISNSSYTSSPVVMANGSAMVTFTGLRSDSTYNISVVAINCAGNNTTTIESHISWLVSCPSPQTTSKLATTAGSIDTPTAVGITFAITFIISFSMGMLVASIILCVCYIPRVSSITTEASIPTTYEVVGINQKQTSTIELESNAAYGTAR